MTFPIEDQLIRGYILGELNGSLSPEMLISEMALSIFSLGISYKEGVLDVKNLKGEFTEAFVEDGVLKLK